MNFGRRQILHFAGGAAALPILTRIASALDFPTRPVRLVVTYPPGGALDVITRVAAQWLSKRMGQPFIVENRAGAGGMVGVEVVANAPADGYTLLMVSSANATNAALYGKTNVDITRDIAPVGGIVRVPNVMEVNPSVPAKTVPEFIAYAKANPGSVNMASGGLGSTGHMNGELFKMMVGLNMLHVPYRGGGPAIADLIGGQVQLLFDPLPGSIEYIKADKVRALAVTSATRSELLPGIPALSEFAPGYEASFWAGVGAPRNAPSAAIEKLNSAINDILADPEFGARISDLGGRTIAGSPAAFGKLIAEEIEKWSKVVKFANIKPE